MGLWGESIWTLPIRATHLNVGWMVKAGGGIMVTLSGLCGDLGVTQCPGPATAPESRDSR